MVKYLYNGVEFPVLPEVDGFDYKFIVHNESAVTKLYIATGTAYVQLANNIKASADLEYIVYDLTDGVWVSSGTETVVADGAICYYGAILLWANYDIKNADDSLRLAASYPTLPTTSGDGYALYNGVKLPNIDSVWTDKETYPYAVLAVYIKDLSLASIGDYDLLLCKHPLSYDGTNIIQGVDDDYLVYSCRISVGESEWSPSGKYDIVEVIYSADQNCTWTSHNILNTDGTTYLAATSPVPLDGMTVIEWDGDTTDLELLQGSSTLYKVTDTYIDKPNDGEWVCVVWNGSGYTTFPQDQSLEFALSTDDEGTAWVLGDVGYVISYNVPGQSLVGTYFNRASEALYTCLFAYTPAAAEEPTKAITDPLSFMVGYQIGCRIRVQRAVKKPIGYLYNGVYLAGELPEWDRAKYPYAFISEMNKLFVCTDVSKHYCYLAGESYAYHFGEGCVYKSAAYDEETNQWGEFGDEVTCISTYTTYAPLWSNFNVLLEDGTTYLVASDPVPVYKGIVAYEYNGVRLPELPDGLNEFNYIANSGDYYYLASATAEEATINEYGAIRVSSSEGILYDVSDGAWIESGADNVIGYVVWSNTDVYNSDGTLYLSASDPVSVYE